jgi:hypothetical protein
MPFKKDGWDGMAMGSTPFRMLSGFNHNIRYKDKVLHIQTEDGGLDSPCIVTYVYFGGEVLDAARQEYRDLLERDDWREALQYRMKAQHLEAIRKLVSGAFDDRLATLQDK